MTAGGAEVGTAYVSVVSSASGLGQSIVDDARSGTAGVEGEATRAGSMFSSAFGAALAVGALAAGAAAGVGKALYDVGATFDDITDTLRVGTGATGANLAGLVDSAKAVGATVPTDLASIGPVIADLNSSLGLTGDNLTTVASQIIQAGKLLGEDVDMDAATGALQAYGVAAADIPSSLDAVFQVAQATGAGFNDLLGTIQTAAPALGELGFSFESTAALIGSLDEAGLNATTVTAGLSKGLVNLAKAGEDPQAAFERITGQIGDLITQGDTAAAIDLASGIFGTKGAVQFVSAVESGSLALDDLTGVAGQTGDTILGLGAETADAAESWQLFKNRTQEALAPLGDAVFGAVGAGVAKLADGVQPAADKIVEIVGGVKSILLDGDFKPFAGLEEDSAVVDFLFNVRDAAQGLIGTFKGVYDVVAPVVKDIFKQIGPSLGPVISGFAQIVPLLSPFGLIFKSLGPVLPQIGGALGDIGKAVGGVLVTAFDALAPVLPVIADLLLQIGAIVAQGLVSAVTAATPLITAIADAFTQLMPAVSSLIADILPPLLDIFQAAVPLVQAVIDVVVDFASFLVSILVPAIQILVPIITAIFDAIKPIIEGALNAIKGIIEFITGLISGDWTLVWTGIKDFVSGIWDAIKSAAETVWNLVRDYIITPLVQAYDHVKNVFGGVVDWIDAHIWTPIKTAVETAWNWVRDHIITPLVEAYDHVKNVFGTIVTWIGVNIWQPLRAAVETAWNFVRDKIIEPIQEAYDFVIGKLTDLKDRAQGIWNDIKAIFSGEIPINATTTNQLFGSGGFNQFGAEGGTVYPSSGGQNWVIGEGWETEFVVPQSNLYSTVAAAVQNTGGSGSGGGRKVAENMTIITQDPDVVGALNQAMMLV